MAVAQLNYAWVCAVRGTVILIVQLGSVYGYLTHAAHFFFVFSTYCLLAVSFRRRSLAFSGLSNLLSLSGNESYQAPFIHAMQHQIRCCNIVSLAPLTSCQMALSSATVSRQQLSFAVQSPSTYKRREHNQCSSHYKKFRKIG